MINETTLTKSLMAELTRQLRGSKTIKHGGNFVSGIPDVSTSYLGDTFWLEDKYLRKGESFTKLFKGRQQQLVTCHELSTTTFGKCWIVLYEQSPERTSIWTPRRMAQKVYPKMVLAEPVTWSAANPDIYDVEFDREMHSPHINLARDMKAYGVIRTAGWRHDFVARLLFDWVKHS